MHMREETWGERKEKTKANGLVSGRLNQVTVGIIGYILSTGDACHRATTTTTTTTARRIRTRTVRAGRNEIW